MQAASSGAQILVAPKIDAGRVSGERALLVVVILVLVLFFFFIFFFFFLAAFLFIVVATVDGALRREGEGRGA
jgi:hypothetical protein